MPSSIRESSVARGSSVGPTARRYPKAHVPFSQDEHNQGRRTGLIARPVARDSDGFEDFGAVLGQLDAEALPKPKGPVPRKPRKSNKKTLALFEDEDVSVDLVDSPPLGRRINAQSAAPSSVRRVGGSSQPVARMSDIDYDRVPSPRAASVSSRRVSQAPRPSSFSRSGHQDDEDDSPAADQPRHRGASTSSRRPASGRLSDVVEEERSSPAPEHARDSRLNADQRRGGRPSTLPQITSRASRRSSLRDSPERGFPDADAQEVEFDLGGGDYDDDDDNEPSRLSFGHLDQDDDDDDADHGAPSPIRSKVDKGKGRAVELEPDEEQYARSEDDEFEQDFDQGMPMDQNSGDQEQEQEETPVKKLTKGKAKKRKSDAMADQEGENEVSAKKTRGRPKGSANARDKKSAPRPLTENINNGMDDDDDDSGLRRGKRTRYKPLEWWRLEKVVYGPGHGLAEIKQIITLPKEPVQPLGGKKKRTKARPKKEPIEVQVYNPEEGWDDKTEPMMVVTDWPNKEAVKRRIAWTAKMIAPKESPNSEFLFQKVFGDAEFMAAGMLIIPQDGSKPTKNSKDNTYVFYVIEGAVKFTVHETPFVICQGGMVLVPRGNFYHIQNCSDREARIFFSQARKTVGELEGAEGGGSVRRSVVPGAGRRAGTAGPSSSQPPSSAPRAPSKGRRSSLGSDASGNESGRRRAETARI